MKRAAFHPAGDRDELAVCRRVIGEYVQPGATAFTLPSGAILTISFLLARAREQ